MKTAINDDNPPDFWRLRGSSVCENGIEIVSEETDRKAALLSQLIKSTRTSLVAYARSKKVWEDIIEDLMQDTCLTAWTHVDAVLESPNPPGWLMNALKMHIRKYFAETAKGGKLAEALAASIDDEPIAFDEYTDGEISFAAALTDDEMHIVVLRAQGYSDREIAAMTKMEHAAIRKRFSRIREKTKRFMDEQQH